MIKSSHENVLQEIYNISREENKEAPILSYNSFHSPTSTPCRAMISYNLHITSDERDIHHL